MGLVFHKCTGLGFFILFYADLFQSFPEPAFVTVFNFGFVSQTFQHFEYLSFSCGTLLAAFGPSVFFSATTTPSSFTLWEISFHLPLDFDLFHWSFELCPTSSTGDDFQWRLDFQSLDDHPVCLWLARKTRRKEAPWCIALKTQGVTAYTEPTHLHSSEHRFHRHHHQARAQVRQSFPCTRPNLCLVHRPQHARTWCVESTIRGSEVAVIARFVVSLYIVHFVPLP